MKVEKSGHKNYKFQCPNDKCKNWYTTDKIWVLQHFESQHSTEDDPHVVVVFVDTNT